MSIFAKRTQKVIAIPFDEPHTVTIQKLSGRQLEQAKEASQFASVDMLKRMGGAGFQKELAELGDQKAIAELVATKQADPLTSLDRLIVLQKGIVGWSYEEALTTAAVEDLTEEAADFLAREIVALTLPVRDEASRKNGSRSSTVS